MNKFDLFFVPKNLFQTNYTFLYCKFGHFPLFYKNTVRGLKIQAINYFFGDSGPYDSHTSLCQRAARVVGCCANQGTLLCSQLEYLAVQGLHRTELNGDVIEVCEWNQSRGAGSR